MDGFDAFGLGVLLLLAMAAGGVAGVAGFGIGSLLTPALALAMDTKLAVAAVAVPHVVATATRLWILRHEIDWRLLRTFGLASAAGGLVGAVLHGLADAALLSIALGVLLVLSGSLELGGIGRKVILGDTVGLAAGAASGLFGGLVGNQGGIRSAALLRFNLTPTALVATATATALLVDAARVPVYVLTSGGDLVRLVPLIGFLSAAVLAGTVLATPLLMRLSQRAFRTMLAVLLILVGLALIGAGVAGSAGGIGSAWRA